jgi:hypothetical protein
VRKLFGNGELLCYSLDCRKAKNGQLCELCADRHRCSRRVQLRLAYLDDGLPRPAILELHRYWFAAFDRVADKLAPDENLAELPLRIQVVSGLQGRQMLEFSRHQLASL